MRYSQPQGPARIDWAKLNPELLILGSAGPVNLGSGNKTISGQPSSYKSAPNGGRTAYFNGSGPGRIYTSVPAPVNDFCFVVSFTPDAEPSSVNFSAPLFTNYCHLSWNHSSASFQGVVSWQQSDTTWRKVDLRSKVAGIFTTVCAISFGGIIYVYQDGVLCGSDLNVGGIRDGGGFWDIGERGDSSGYFWAGSVSLVALHSSKSVTPLLAKELSANPWQIFADNRRPIFVGLGSSAPTNPTGDLAATETGSDTASFSGQVVVQGALDVTETGIDTAVIQGGASPVTGTLAATESGIDTASIAGQVIVQGTTASNETGADTSATAGQVIVQGDLSVTETGTDTALLNGSSQITTIGALSATESDIDSCVSTGAVLVQGLLDAAETGGDTVYAPGQIYVIGALSAAETGSDTCAMTNVVIEFSPSVYQAISPVLNYTALSPAMSYTVSVNPQTYSA